MEYYSQEYGFEIRYFWNEKFTSGDMIVITGSKNEFQHLVSQIINRTTSERVELVGNVT